MLSVYRSVTRCNLFIDIVIVHFFHNWQDAIRLSILSSCSYSRDTTSNPIIQLAHASFFPPVLKTFSDIFPCTHARTHTRTHALIKTKYPMQVAAVYRHEIVMRSRFRSSGGQNDKRRRSSSAAKERLMRKCSELCIRGNRCGKMRPQSATFLYSIKDSSDVDDTCNCGSYYGIIEVGSSYASSLVDHFHDASPWRTTLENVRNMNLDGKYVTLTNISATCTNAPNKSWVDVARAFHESGAKSVQYKNM